MPKIKLRDGDRPYNSLVYSPAKAGKQFDSCYYTVARYVPDPNIERFITIAVIVFTEVEVQCRIKDLEELLVFGNYNDGELLKEFCDRLAKDCSKGRLFYAKSVHSKTRVEMVEHIAKAWENKIKLRYPWKSLGNIASVIDKTERDFLLLGGGEWVRSNASG
jgi:hypothetical protein